MHTDLLETGTPALLQLAAAAAVRLLRAGEPVALPTETVYGLAADALRPLAVAKIFEAKERPFFDPLICHLPDLGWLDRFTRIPTESRPLVERLIERYWPGPLTLILPRRDCVPDLVTSGLETVAVRMSVHPVFRAVAALFGGPLAAPSANRFGRISPTAASHVLTELGGRIPLIVDGGPTAHGLESTIVSIEGEALRIFRNGPVTREELGALAEVLETPRSGAPQAPGQLASHYAPATRVLLLEKAGLRGAPLGGAQRVGLLAWSQRPETDEYAAFEILSPSSDLREAAATLFAKLRRLDEAGLDLIACEPVPEHGLGAAIMDRLRKAAGRGGE